MTEAFDLGFGIADFGLNGKAHGAEGIALEVSEISELSTCRLCAIASSIEYPATSYQSQEISNHLNEHNDPNELNHQGYGETTYHHRWAGGGR